jgi:large subunit ribosomal protein L24
MKIKKGDKVLIIAGKDRGKIGTVDLVSKKTRRLIVSGVNIVTKHSKPSRKNPKGGLTKMPQPLNFAKVMLVCPKCDKPARVGYLIGKAGKERVCRRCKQVIG